MNKILGWECSLNVTECKCASFIWSEGGGAWLSKDLTSVLAKYNFWERLENPGLWCSGCLWSGSDTCWKVHCGKVRLDFSGTGHNSDPLTQWKEVSSQADELQEIGICSEVKTKLQNVWCSSSFPREGPFPVLPTSAANFPGRLTAQTLSEFDKQTTGIVVPNLSLGDDSTAFNKGSWAPHWSETHPSRDGLVGLAL